MARMSMEWWPAHKTPRITTANIQHLKYKIDIYIIYSKSVSCFLPKGLRINPSTDTLGLVRSTNLQSHLRQSWPDHWYDILRSLAALPMPWNFSNFRTPEMTMNLDVNKLKKLRGLHEKRSTVGQIQTQPMLTQGQLGWCQRTKYCNSLWASWSKIGETWWN